MDSTRLITTSTKGQTSIKSITGVLLMGSNICFYTRLDNVTSAEYPGILERWVGYVKYPCDTLLITNGPLLFKVTKPNDLYSVDVVVESRFDIKSRYLVGATFEEVIDYIVYI